ncbi:SDR family oxidoreductase [Motiliproteus sp. SC1-56]|uniref:SDR family oxidoreductase n=1 Tax=Motiliproteus sp. SC1-56 TaxID=2799565 RepID=UPI001A8DEE97|nr:SDR family oxidoreductase [Motiliproteus sp. SC1-56]
MATILLVGCGDIGSHLGLTLARQGHRCIGLKRQIAGLPAAIEGVAGDVTRPETLSGLPRDVDYLVYSVAAPRFDADCYRAVYVQGLGNVLQALQGRQTAPRRCFFVSSSAVYHQRDGEWVDETSPTRPTSFSGQAMLEAERLLEEAPLATTAVRLSGIYGPGRRRLLEWVKAGVACAAEPVLYSNRIHRDDAVGILDFLIRRDLDGQEVAGLYLASDPHPSPYHEVLEWLRQALALPLPAPERYEDFSQRLRTGSKRCDSSRLQASGYRFIYPSYREGFADLIAEERAAGG